MKRVKHNISRFTAMLLAVIMIVGMLPATAFADEGAPTPELCATEGCEYAAGHEGACSNAEPQVEQLPAMLSAEPTAQAAETRDIVVNTGKTVNNWVTKITFKNVAGSDPQTEENAFVITLDSTTDRTKPIEIEIEYKTGAALGKKHYFAINNEATFLRSEQTAYNNYFGRKVSPFKYNTSSCDDGVNFFIPAWKEVDGTWQATLQFGYVDKATATTVKNPITVVLKIGTGEAVNLQPTIVGKVAEEQTFAKNATGIFDVTEKFSDPEGKSLTYYYSVDSEEDYQHLQDGKLSITFTRDVTTGADYTLRFKATDGEKDSQVYTVFVNVVNTRPALNPGVADKTMTVVINEQIDLDWTDLFSDKNGDPLTYKITTKKDDEDAKVKYTNYEGTTYSCIYGIAGTYTFEIKAFDGGDWYSDGTYTITVTVKEPEAAPPDYDNTYDVTVNVPTELTPKFYVTKIAPYDGEDTHYDRELEAVPGATANGFTAYTVKVPENIDRISYRAVDAEGKSWGGMSVETKAEAGAVIDPLYLRPLKGVVKLRVDGQALTAAQALFKVKTTEGLWGVKGDADVENGYLYYRYLLAAYGNDATYTYYAVPLSDLANTYSEGMAEDNPIVADSAESEVYPLPFSLKSSFTVIAPAGAEVKMFNQNNNYVSLEQPCVEKKENGDMVEWTFVKVGTGKNMSYRVSMDGMVTKAGYVSGKADDVSATVTWDEDDIEPTGRREYDLNTRYGARGDDSVYLNVNSKNHLVLDNNELFRLRAFRVWQIINNDSWNIMVEPDFTYTVHSGADVISITSVEENNGNAKNNWLDIQAKKDTGVAIVEVGYDAVDFPNGTESVDGYGSVGMGAFTFNAVDPARTGLVVVQVGNAAEDVKFGFSFSYGETREWDVDHDTVYFLGDKGQITFAPTVKNGSVAEVAVSNDKGNTWSVLTATDGMYTADIVSGNNILRVKKSDGTEAYQVVRGDKLTVTLFDGDKDGEIEAGEEITVRISGLHFPVGKMSGIYNPGGITTAYMFNGATVKAQSKQYQCSQTELVVTVPRSAAEGTEIVLTNGKTGASVIGGAPGKHRGLTDAGNVMDGSASTGGSNRNILPDITIVVGDSAIGGTQEQENRAPVRKSGVAETGQGVAIKVGDVFSLNLGTIFEDADGNTLNYKVSKNTAAAENASRNYSFVPTKEGTYTLMFTANDGKVNSTDTYTVTITVSGVAQKQELKFDLAESEIAGYVTISFEDYGIRLEEELEDIDVLYRTPLGDIIEATKVPFATYDTIATVTLRLLNAMGMYAGYGGTENSGFYLTSIGKFVANETYYDTFAEKQAGDASGWMITLNKGGTGEDWFINRGANAFVVGDGDIIKWKYSCQLGADIGDNRFLEAANSVVKLIDKIGTPITEASETAINVAREAYEALSTAQQAAVSNYEKLVAAEKAFAEIKATGADKEAAEKVNVLIAAIGTPITEGSETAINAAREAYDKLTALQKLLCDSETLETAENLYQQLINKEEAETIYKNTGKYMIGLGTPSVADIGGDWMVIGLVRSSYDCPKGYYGNVLEYVEKNINTDEQLHSTKSTENARVVLALTAAGYDVTNVGGHNLLMGLTDMEYVKKQGINGPIWTLLAFDSHKYEIPGNAKATEQVTRDKLIDYILGKQLSDGGWALSGKSSDSDMTGMALTALAPYYNSNNKVKVAINKALAKLSSMQLSDGSFGSIDGASAESCAQVIVALTALGIDPETDTRFIKKGISAVDALCAFAVEGGGFCHVLDTERDGMATEQGYYALAAYFRFLDKKSSLYDMNDVKIKSAAETVESLIDAIGEVSYDAECKNRIDAARAAYNALSSADKAKVSNYKKLTKAEAEYAQLEKDHKAADRVIDLINSIGYVTLNSENKILRARAAYNSLTYAQKKLVYNYSTLLYAEERLEELKIEQVEELINAIGTVTLDSKAKIERARAAYDALSSAAQKKVSNLNVLVAAEKAYDKLVKEAKEKEAAKRVNEVCKQIESIGEDATVEELLDAILAFDTLTEAEKTASGKAEGVEALKKQIAEMIQTDTKTGISVSDVEWNIQLVVEKEQSAVQTGALQEKLGNNTLLGLWDIYLKDIILGQEVQPDGTVLVKIPLTLLGDYSGYDGLAVVHCADDGTVEYLSSEIAEECVTFHAADFSYYAVVGYMGDSPLDGMMNDEASDAVVTPWIITGCCAVVLLGAVLYLNGKSRKQKAGKYAE